MCLRLSVLRQLLRYSLVASLPPRVAFTSALPSPYTHTPPASGRGVCVVCLFYFFKKSVFLFVFVVVFIYRKSPRERGLLVVVL